MRVCSMVPLATYEIKCEFCVENCFLLFFFFLPGFSIYETFLDVARPTQTKFKKQAFSFIFETTVFIFLDMPQFKWIFQNVTYSES